MASKIGIVIVLVVSKAIANDYCRKIDFVHQFKGKSLEGHVLERFEAASCELCQIQCFLNERCVSYNCGENECELNWSDHTLVGSHYLVDKEGKMYYASKNACNKDRCVANATCLNGFTDKGFKCECPLGFEGSNCEEDICKKKLIGKPEQHKVGDSEGRSFYCLPGCEGGWMLVMKINGSKKTFHYDSPYWTNRSPYDEQNGLTGLDDKETKLPAYWNRPLKKICVGMKTKGPTEFLLVNQAAISLYFLLSHGNYTATNLSRENWKSLIPGSSLQTKCNKEGFNVEEPKKVHQRVRIGVISDDQDTCNNHNSRIGFGSPWHDLSYNTCGNYAKNKHGHGSDNGKQNIKAMGYIFIQ